MIRFQGKLRLRYRLLLIMKRLLYEIFNMIAKYLRLKPRKILLEDMSDELFDKALEKVKDYAVSMISIKMGESGEEAHFLGSGTLVKIDELYCILTAGHVLDCQGFKESDIIGLCFREGRHEFKLPRNNYMISHKRNRTIIKDGPDLGILILPAHLIDDIRARKSFWNMRYHQKRVLSKPYGDLGLWAALGVVDELTTRKRTGGGFHETLRLSHFLWFGPVKRRKKWNRDGFDYLESIVNYKTDPQLPRNFGGLSGAGLWQIPYFKEESGIIKCGEPILSGVTYYQSEIKRGVSHLRHHGRMSIYEKLLNIFNTDDMKITPA